MAKSNITFIRNPTDAVVSDYMARCRAFIFPAEEDFGITVVEAQASGAPVIAYGQGGSTETVLSGKTGVLFPQQTVHDLVEAVNYFETHQKSFIPEIIRNHAETFSEQRFQQEFWAFVAQKWLKFRQDDALE
jgi:glycosyltransferase involved in cell wall biosynthesis